MQTIKNMDSPLASKKQNPHDRLVRLQELQHTVGYSKASIYAKVKSGEFPLPIKLGGRASAWLLSEVEAWIDSRVRLSRGVAA